MLQFIFVLSSIIIYNVQSLPAPQDPQTAAIMMAGQVKDVVENGAAAKDSKDMEFFGIKAKSDMGVGFGDAAKSRRRRDVHAINAVEENNKPKRPKRAITTIALHSSSSSESSEF